MNGIGMNGVGMNPYHLFLFVYTGVKLHEYFFYCDLKLTP